MSNNTSILIVGIVAAALLCGSAVAVIAIANTNDDSMSYEQREFYRGYEDGYNSVNQIVNTGTAIYGEALNSAKLSASVAEVQEGDQAFFMEKDVKSLAVVEESDAYRAGFFFGQLDAENGTYDVEEAYSSYCLNEKSRLVRVPAADVAVAEA